MLTRCMLKLDNIECNNVEDRNNRKQIIVSVNQAIAVLERKVVNNSDMMQLESDLSKTLDQSEN